MSSLTQLGLERASEVGVLKPCAINLIKRVNVDLRRKNKGGNEATNKGAFSVKALPLAVSLPQQMPWWPTLRWHKTVISKKLLSRVLTSKAQALTKRHQLMF